MKIAKRPHAIRDRNQQPIGDLWPFPKLSQWFIARPTLTYTPETEIYLLSAIPSKGRRTSDSEGVWRHVLFMTWCATVWFRASDGANDAADGRSIRIQPHSRFRNFPFLDGAFAATPPFEEGAISQTDDLFFWISAWGWLGGNRSGYGGCRRQLWKGNYFRFRSASCMPKNFIR